MTGGSGLLKLEEVKVYGLEPVSFQVSAGECLAVQGPSGAGKTVLLRAIADLDPVEGRIALDDTDRLAVSGPAWRARVRYAAAEPGWWDETPRPHFRDPDSIAEIVRALGLGEGILGQPLARISTGERQRLALARALEDSPDVLLLDEPTGALDAKATARAEKLLKTQLKTGRIILLVSHDPEQIARMANRKMTIRGGKVRVART